MTSEIEWVKSIAERMNSADQLTQVEGISVGVGTGAKLPYRHRLLGNQGKGSSNRNVSAYETGLLLYDQLENGWWVPRVVIECKLKGVTSNDTFTFDFLAATHKHRHQYLRYGVLIGDMSDNSLPVRPFRHGYYFDFMIGWEKEAANQLEWGSFLAILTEEIMVSRQIQELSGASLSQSETRYSIVHRQLKFR
jgi:hypothetical protein